LKIGTPKEVFKGEARVAMTPDSALQLQKLGYDCVIETGAGKAAGFDDAAYKAAGVEVVKTAAALWKAADIIAKVRPPTDAEAKRLTRDKTLISFFWPAQNTELLDLCKDKGANVIAMDMVPRISRAQKMDALSSMANIAGYRAVIEAGNNFGRFFTGQVTAAGKVPPAKVLVVGAGVAGLAAIGTSTSLGAITYAFDVRPEVAEQIESMGAEFVYLDFEERRRTARPPAAMPLRTVGGVPRKAAEEVPRAGTRHGHRHHHGADPQPDAPKLWLKDMVEAMKPGSVVVDLAAERGGNCKLTVPDEKIVTDNGVTIIGYTDFPSRMATQSSTLYGTNIRHMMTDLTPEKDGKIVHNMEDDVIRGATVAFMARSPSRRRRPRCRPLRRRSRRKRPKELTPEEKAGAEIAAFKAQTKQQVTLLAVGGALMLLGRPVRAGKLHAALHRVRAVGVRRLPGDLECQPFAAYAADGGDQRDLVDHHPRRADADRVGLLAGHCMLAALSVFMAGINIFGGFLVTRRMLAMFQKS
jgi:NAD(P) transhydrogenase subunit alpha